MKICFFIATMNDSGGTQRVTAVIADQFAKKGYEVSIIIWYGGTTTFFALHNNIKTYCLFKNDKISIYKNYVASVNRYKKIIQHIKPDVVIDVCVPLSLVTAASLFLNKKIKKIAWEHFNAGVSWNFITGKMSRRLVTAFYKKTVVLTSADKELYEKKFNAKNVIVIPNPVTLDATRKSNLSSNIVLAIGRLTYQKGFDLLLQAWALIYQQYPGWKLRIVGGGEELENLTKMTASLNLQDNVELVEPTVDIEKHYLDASLYVMSSRFEGLPLVLIEAKAFGLPLISFNCETGPRDIIKHNYDGLLIEPGNVKALADGMALLMSSPAMRLTFSKNSVELLQHFSMPEIFSQWEKTLTEVTLN